MILQRRCIARLLLLCATLSHQALADEVVPRDFQLVAEFGPGGAVYLPDTFCAWTVTIDSDGRVTQVVQPITQPGHEVKTSTSLSRADLNDLLAAIKTADFGSLPARVQGSFHEGPALRLRVTASGKTHEVIVYAPVFKGNIPEVKRFLKVWSEVVKKVPPPPGQAAAGGH